MKKKILVLLISMMCAMFLSGCELKQPKICVTMYPIQYLVDKIGGDRVTCTTIGDGNIAIRSHINADWQEQLSDADLFLYMGQVEPYLQIYLPEIRQMENLEIIDLANTTSLYSFQRYTTVQVGESTIGVESPYYEGVAFNSIDMYDNDPYIWLDPVAMTSMGNQIRKWLIANYPEESEYFNANYTVLETELAQLDSQYQLLKPVSSNIKIVTMSPSFGTWQKNYGLQVYPVILSRYGVLPNEEQLALIKERIIKDEVNYIVTETNLTDDMKELYDQLVDELNLMEIKLSNLSGLTETQISENKDYVQIMYENLAMIESIAQ